MAAAPVGPGAPEFRRVEPTQNKCGAVAKRVDQNRMIFLSGCSTSGKTSIMSAFCSLEKNSVQLGVDDFFKDTYLPSLIKTHLAEDYQVLSLAFNDDALYEACNPNASIEEVLQRNPGLIKPEATLKEREQARSLLANRAEGSFQSRFVSLLDDQSQGSQQSHFEAILEQFKKGKTVIFDTGSTVEFFEFIHNRGIKVEDKVNHLLVYLPLTHLVQRAEMRNELATQSGELGNRRPLTQVIHDFTKHYKPAGPDDKVVDVMKRSDIENIFKQYSPQINEGNERAKEFEGPQVTLKSVLTHFGFEEGVSEVPITTSFRIPIGILLSQKHSAMQSAQSLHDHTFQRIQ